MELGDKVRSVLERKGSVVWSISPQASVFEAVQLMAEKDIGALAVLEGRRVVGIFSERDYARKIILEGKSSKHTSVHEVMTHPVISVDPEDTVDECMHLMTDHRVRHLPVISGGELAGMVSIGDLVNWIISAQAETIGHLHSYIAGSYPG
jgi:CBS domain-containing protein